MAKWCLKARRKPCATTLACWSSTWACDKPRCAALQTDVCGEAACQLGKGIERCPCARAIVFCLECLFGMQTGGVWAAVFGPRLRDGLRAGPPPHIIASNKLKV